MAEQPQTHEAHSKPMDGLGIRDAVSRPLNVVFLGAGSGFFEKLFADLLFVPGTQCGGEMRLVDIDAERLELARQMGEKVAAALDAPWTVRASTDRRAMLDGADYVVNCIEVSGVQAVRIDYEIPLKYGVGQCIGGTIGPGGRFKALRTAPVFLEVLWDIEELCPDAWVLNYTNPMSILCLAAARASSAHVVGLCHSVQGTSRQLAGYADVPYEELTWRCGGINHLSWFTELSRNGQDVYPVLFEKARTDPATWEQDPVRFDVMEHFGYFVTESSGHLSEYLPYYRKRKDLLAHFMREKYRGESGFYANMWPAGRAARDERRKKVLAGEEPLEPQRTFEYCSFIIQAIETNAPFVFHGTVPNAGLIENLPAEGVVEVACLADRRGVTPTHFGPLPPHCAAVCDWNLRMFDVAATACIEKSRERAFQALLLDPLTAAVCSPAEIRRMTDEMFEAQADLLPGW